MASSHVHVHHFHAPHVPDSAALLGMVIGVVIGPPLLLGIVFLIAKAISGV